MLFIKKQVCTIDMKGNIIPIFPALFYEFAYEEIFNFCVSQIEIIFSENQLISDELKVEFENAKLNNNFDVITTIFYGCTRKIIYVPMINEENDIIDIDYICSDLSTVTPIQKNVILNLNVLNQIKNKDSIREFIKFSNKIEEEKKKKIN